MNRTAFKTKTAKFFKQLGFDMDVTESTQTWDEQVMNGVAFALYMDKMQKTEIKHLEDALFQAQTQLT